MGILIAVVIGAALLALIPMWIAHEKGRSRFVYYVWGFLFFIPTLIVALVISPTETGVRKRQEAGGFQPCPYCAEMIRPEATVCRYCGRDVQEIEPEWEGS